MTGRAVNPFHRSNRRGASLLGYGLIVGLIAVVSLASVSSVGSQVTTLFGTVAGQLPDGDGSGSGPSAEPQPTATATPSPSPVAVTGALTAGDPGIFADGASAVSCNEYLVASTPDDYAPATGGSGVYTVDPDGNNTGNAPFNVYCDMDPSTGGWMLAGRIHSATVDSVDEPDNWFTAGRNASELLSLADNPDGGMVGHGSSLFNGIIVDNGTLSRFVVRAADDFSTTVTFYKRVTTANFNNWFEAAESTATATCTDAAMTSNCTNSAFTRLSGVYNLVGMEMSKHGYSGGVLHTRQNGAAASYFSGLCSSTLNNNGNAWPDSYQQHWGNVLEIWIR